jgi:murein L,D-transpeptidase YafK
MRAILRIGLLLMLVLGAVVAWDMLKLTRTPPALAAPGARATLVRVEKQARRLTLLHGDTVLGTYEVSLGSDPTGHKQREGDGRTPEGQYAVDFKHPRSRFHLALRVSYPSPQDRQAAAARGEKPGSDIMIHGLRNGFAWLAPLHLAFDWTDGCVAVSNREIEEIWSRVDVGTTVEIKP